MTPRLEKLNNYINWAMAIDPIETDGLEPDLDE